jgi:hypothetical protein
MFHKCKPWCVKTGPLSQASGQPVVLPELRGRLSAPANANFAADHISSYRQRGKAETMVANLRASLEGSTISLCPRGIPTERCASNLAPEEAVRLALMEG